MQENKNCSKPDRVLSMLGIAAKAGKLVSGEFATEKSVKSKSAYLVVLAEDASANTKKKFRDMSDFYHVALLFYGTKDTLGSCIGKDYRSSLAITDESLAKAVTQKWQACAEVSAAQATKDDTRR